MILELRQYTLHPGQRDTLIELFDREFIEPQEALGMSVIGQFRVAENPDLFFWLRGFENMETRLRGLSGFYGGPVWKRHRDAANATMIDSDNVLLLHPARPDSNFTFSAPDESSDGLVAHIYYFDAPVTDEFVAYFESTVVPAAERAGAKIRGYFTTDYSVNNFPALPVRDEHAFVWFSSGALDRNEAQWREIETSLLSRLKTPPEIRTLTPTAGSRLR